MIPPSIRSIISIRWLRIIILRDLRNVQYNIWNGLHWGRPRDMHDLPYFERVIVEVQLRCRWILEVVLTDNRSLFFVAKM